MVYDTTPVRVELPAQGQGVGPGDETETGEPVDPAERPGAEAAHQVAMELVVRC